MRVLSKSRKHFHGTHKGAEIVIERELARDPCSPFYILVTWKDGGHLYDGWAPDHVHTMAEAKREARRGAMLDDPAEPCFARPRGAVDRSGMENEMSDWQPIDSAPKDGTVIDVWCPAVGRVADVQWEPYVGDFARSVTIEGEPGWSHHPNSPPTHWQPLPEPPR